MRLLLDSTYVIDYLNGAPEARVRWQAVWENGDEPVLNEIVVCEVRTGLHGRGIADFDVFLEPIEFVQPGPTQALLAGRWRAEARAAGFHLSLADALIAAAAESADAAVLTRSLRDFALTPVRVETY